MILAIFFLTREINGAQMGDPEDRGASSTEKAIFAGGCFWCMEHAVDDLPGVISTTVGYTGGRKINPTYEEVSAGGTGHAESVLVIFDPQKISYAELLEVFWHNIDPTVKDQQFCDQGNQYRSAIFYLNDTQKKLAEGSKQALLNQRVPGLGIKRFKNIYTEIVPASKFYEAEEYHQGYHKKNPIRYSFYRATCGRDNRLSNIWKRERRK
ncbi:MAG: peptide-methionine (S)-S-oxide reductase MsrA [Nitrospirae bacterium]|nr:peptide-methionine (S)-S-oxide reductase MsrA [Candidatus Troglogloeales bacterium]